MIIKNYNPELYLFSQIVANVFKVTDLSLIHKERTDLLPTEKLVFENESRTDFHKLFYEKMNGNELQELEASFNLFVKNEVAPLFGEDILHQYMPSFRVHLPGDQAIHKWHYDSDDDHRHPNWEINFQIPLTDTYETQSTWIESVPGLRDFNPMNMKVGQYAIFDGNRCMHGNKENATDLTRVSFDFRVIPSSRYENNTKESVTTSKKFTEGEYYRRVKK